MTQELNEKETAALNHVDHILRHGGSPLQVSETHLETLQDLARRARVLLLVVNSQKERTFNRQALIDLRDAYKRR